MANPGKPDPATCKHARTQVIAEDADAKYVECLDCGAILEAGEIKERRGSVNRFRMRGALVAQAASRRAECRNPRRSTCSCTRRSNSLK